MRCGPVADTGGTPILGRGIRVSGEIRLSREDVHQKAQKRCEQFFISLQQDVEDWISLGTTKTGMVYRLKGNAPQGQ